MELTERETLIKVEQQLQDSIKNQSQILGDLKEIFNRIESESKVVAAIGAELRTHRETSSLRWSELDKKITSLEKSIAELSKEKDSIHELVTDEKEERTAADSLEQKEREKFQENITTSFKTTTFIIGGIVGLIGLIVTIFEIIGHVKGN